MESATAPPVVEHQTGKGTSLDTYLRWTVAAFSLTAAAIHFGFAPTHLAEDWAHGWFFMAVAWSQAAFAVLIVTRPRRWVWAAGLAVNLVVVLTWFWSRTSGIPFGPVALRKEAFGTPDVVCALIEGGIVVSAMVALFAPKLLERTVLEKSFARVLAGSVGLLAIVAGTVSLTPAYAGGHTHAAGVTDGHDHSGATATLAGTSDCELSGPPASPGQVTLDAEGHDHRGPAVQEPLTREERVTLEAQQAQARTTIERYPTVTEAEAAGYHASTAYVPCIGAHYTNVGLVMGFDPANPSELLYDGTNPDSKLVGLSFLSYHPGGPPEGFAGPNDRWHQHNINGGLCFGGKGFGVIGGEAMTVDECAAIGGQKRELTDIWMVHDWIVPGWECSWGVFAGECPDLGGRTGGTAWDAPDPSATGQALGG